MKISQALTPDIYEFACKSKACAPPPAGTGGSRPSGGGGANARIRANKAKADAKFDAEKGKTKSTMTLDKLMNVPDRRESVNTRKANNGGGLPRYRGPNHKFKTPEHHTDHSGSGGRYRAMKPDQGTTPRSNRVLLTGPTARIYREMLKRRGAATKHPATKNDPVVRITQPTRARPKVKLSMEGIPWATPNTRHPPHVDPDHPQPIFQAPRKKSQGYWGVGSS